MKAIVVKSCGNCPYCHANYKWGTKSDSLRCRLNGDWVGNTKEDANMYILPTCPLKDLIDEVRLVQNPLFDEGRLDFWAKIQDGYCPHCGSSYLPCYCLKDECQKNTNFIRKH